MNEYLFCLIPVGIALIGYALIGFSNTISDAIHGDGGHSRRHKEFVETRIREGASYQDAMNELYLREELARLRREASERVDADIENWQEIIDTTINEAFQRVGLTNPDLITAFGDAIRGLSYGHILYPTQADKVDRLEGKGTRDLLVGVDQYAALRDVN